MRTNLKKCNTVEPRYPDTLRTRKKYRHKRSVAVTGVGETYVYKKLFFFMNLRKFKILTLLAFLSIKTIL